MPGLLACQGRAQDAQAASVWQGTVCDGMSMAAAVCEVAGPRLTSAAVALRAQQGWCSAAQRSTPPGLVDGADHGVPLLGQLLERAHHLRCR